MTYSEQAVKGLRMMVLAVVFILGVTHLLEAGETIRSLSAPTAISAAAGHPQADAQRELFSVRKNHGGQRMAQAAPYSRDSGSKEDLLHPPPRLLRISVHQGWEPPGEIQSRRVLSTRKGRSGETVHIAVLEGEIGAVRIGDAVSITQGSLPNHLNPSVAYFSTEYVQAARGFLVMPKLEGDKVMLRIASSGNRFSRRGDSSVEIFEADTVVRGPLGEWLPVAGVQDPDSRSQLGAGHSVSTKDAEYPQFWVRAVIPTR